MKNFAILGGGSIGRRHAKNLQQLNQTVRIIEPHQPDPLKAAGFAVYDALEAAFAPEVDAVLVCSPTIYHLEHTRTAIEAGKHVFIEKPISHTWAGVDELVEAAQQAGVVSLVGFNMRFRDGFQRVQEFVTAGRIGKPLAARALVAYYLPHYHPHLDYRTRYQAQRALGGGVILDDIHELDYLSQLFGAVHQVFAIVETLSDLEIDVEDFAAITLRHASGVITQLQMDYLSRVYRRTLEITGNEATLTLDHNTGEIRIYGPEDGQYAVFPQKMSVTVNDMYMAEMQHFVACVEGRETPLMDLSVGRDVLRVALATFESAQQKRMISL